jgi:hypothetical protein
MYRKSLKSPFPEDLYVLAQQLANYVGLDFTPEAAIVNYYPLNGNMGGHLDDAEHTMEKPIVSLSLGCPAIFLLGGRSRTVKPTPILVRSGDVVIMSGESRFSYHGVPGILPMSWQGSTAPLSHMRDAYSTSAETVLVSSEPAAAIDLLGCYAHMDAYSSREQYALNILRNGRINMNIRQVTVGGANASEDLWIDKAGSGATAANSRFATAVS